MVTIVCSRCGNALPPDIRRFYVVAEKISKGEVRHYHYCCPCWNRVCGISAESREQSIRESKLNL